MQPMDILCNAAAEKGPVCVGLDTARDYLPPAILAESEDAAGAIFAYNKALIDATSDAAACYKIQIAYYESEGLAGLRAYADTLAYLRARSIPVIADIKRGDIADTAARYARAHFEGPFEADFVTLVPYLGMDSLEPWRAYHERGKGVFVLLKTSNAGGRDFQNLALKEGGIEGSTASTLYEAVGDRLAELADNIDAAWRGELGYSAAGAVVGCTNREEAAAIRARYPQLFFLVPGYGAQGGAANDAALLFNRSGDAGKAVWQGNGAVVNASRSILLAWKKDPDAADAILAMDAKRALKACADAARRETAAMRDALFAAAASENERAK